MIPFLILASTSILTQTVAQAQEPSNQAVARECPIALPAGEVEGETVSCGLLSVPENYQEPNGRQLEISYAVLHSRSLSPAPDPVIDLRGGPGGSVIDTEAFQLRSTIYEALRQTRDIVLFDQRGAKFSERLGCAPFFLGATILLETDPEFAQLMEQIEGSLDSSPLTDEQTIALHSLCSQGLIEHGYDLNQFNTPNSARDVVNLAAALGYDTFNLYGISYGTYLALQVMRDRPENIRSVVLDSTAAPQVNKYEGLPRAYEASMMNLFEDCERDENCNVAYPNLRDRYKDLINNLLDNPISLPNSNSDVGSSISITPQSLVDLVVQMNQDPRVAPYIPLIVHELEQGITSTYEGILSGDIFTEAEQTAAEPGSAEDYILRAGDLKVEADRILSEQAELAQLQRPSSQWVEQVRTQIESFEEEEETLATVNFLGVGFQSNLPQDRTTLLGFLDETFPEEVAISLSAPIEDMSGEEIHHVYEVLNDTLDTVFPLDSEISFGMFRTMDCREQVPFSDPDRTAATYLDLEMPLLGGELFTLSEQAYAACSVWPVDPGPASDHQVLESDIPTLVLGGRYDTQTPIFLAIEVMEGLSNGTFVEFPNTGHGAIAFSRCAQDIGVAFINNPTQPPQTSCTDELKPQFIMPDDE